MKELPQKFAVKANRESELFGEFIKWLNETYDDSQSFVGTYVDSDAHYGYNGDQVFCRRKKNINYPSEIEFLTLKEWAKIIGINEFEYGDEVRGRVSGTAQWREGIYISEAPQTAGKHILYDVVNCEPFVVYKVDEKTLDGEVREIDGHKYKLNLVE